MVLQLHFRTGISQRLELGGQFSSTTDHYQLLLIQYGEDLNTIRAEPAGVIAKSGLDECQELTSKGFLYLTGAEILLFDPGNTSVPLNC